MQGNKKSYGSRFLESNSFIAGYRLFKKAFTNDTAP